MQYKRFLGQLEQYPVLRGHAEDKIRFDYDPKHMLLSVRKPTRIYESLISRIELEIINQLAAITHRGDLLSVKFAASIYSGRSSTIFLEGNKPDSDVALRQEPDAQFMHQDAAQPGVVIEVSYSQHGKDPRKLARNYIQDSNGDIKVVIIFDIGHGKTKEATVSVWRLRYIREDGEDLEILDVEETITPQAFRAADGSL